MARHLASLASSGWVDCSCGSVSVEDDAALDEGDVRERFARRVSWTPGAAGAPAREVVYEA